jgi:hypothetical protein
MWQKKCRGKEVTIAFGVDVTVAAWNSCHKITWKVENISTHTCNKAVLWE